MRIDLLRHGTTGRDGHLDGRTDPPLSETGWEQFRRQTQSRIWRSGVSSPLARARAGAEEYARQTGCALDIDTDWSELDFGIWDGRTHRDIAAEPGGEALLETFMPTPQSGHRVVRAGRICRREWRAQHVAFLCGPSLRRFSW
ncbi:histidine phosphatase family protein [Bradyrhizobium oligotrophicum S58]